MIVCTGEALMDMVPDGGKPDAFLARPGGCPFNTAIAAARLGAEVSFLGRLGTDFFGARLYDRLAANGVDVSRVARRDQGATLAFVSRSPEGDARYAFYSQGAADRSFAAEDLPARLPPEARFLMLGSITMLQEPLASTVESLASRERGNLLVSFDPNIRPSLIADRGAYLARFERWTAMSAIVKISSDDLEWLYPGQSAEAGMARLATLGPSLVVATLGREGAVARTARVEARAPAFAVKVADTIGAGDTFHAALLARLDEAGVRTRSDLEGLGQDQLAQMLRFANAAAAVNCTRTGAEPPSAEETRDFLARH
ncbi:MAG: carbohydrate kinase [Treponema sp.]|nr:carbohydrate kinase [Treponema sp.]